MVYVSQYEISTNGRAVVLPGGFELLRTQIGGALLVRGPRGSAGALVKLENVLAVRELDEYVIDLQNGQATIKQGELKTNGALEAAAGGIMEGATQGMFLYLGLAAIGIFLLYKVVTK